VFTLRVEEAENGSLVASIQKEMGNDTPVSLGFYNRYRHRYQLNTLPASTSHVLSPCYLAPILAEEYLKV